LVSKLKFFRPCSALRYNGRRFAAEPQKGEEQLKGEKKMKFKNPFKKRKGVQDENAQKELQMYYDIGPIDATNAIYRMIIGQRSNGKTYSVCRHMVEDYFSKGHRSAYIRRWDEDIQPKHLASLFAPHYKLIEELSGGEYNSVFYRAKEFHLCYIDEEGKKVAQDPEAFCITASINTAEHTKG